MMRRQVVQCALFLVCLVSVPGPAHAVILNFGVDIFSDGTNSLPATSFFGGDADNVANGRVLTPTHVGQPGPSTYLLTLDAASVFGGYTINSASLFIDGFNVDTGDAMTVLVQGVSVGSLADNSGAGTLVPVITGGTAATALTSDVDNTFYTLGSFITLSDLATDSTFTIQINNTHTGNSVPRQFRIDGINLQADATLIDDGGNGGHPPPFVPEPSSMLLVGLGGLGAGLFRKRKSTDY